MKNPALWITVIIVAIIAAAIAGALYFWKGKTEQEARIQQLPHTAEVTQPPPAVSAEPEIPDPVPEIQRAPSAEAKPLPPLNQSDGTIHESIARTLGQQTAGDLFISKDIARRVVTTVDNLPRTKVSERLFPVKPPAGQTVTTGDGPFVSLSPGNYTRYTPYVRLAQAADAKTVVAAYHRFYPLFQEAYRDLGYPKKDFNDRLLEAIDDLLAAPEVQEPVELRRPKVMYEFADPDLEDLSAGQKIMIRMGSANAGVIKTKLREIRRELSAGAPAAQR